MKIKITIALLALGLAVQIRAQEGGQVAQGKWLIEINTGFGAGGLGHTANTGFV